MAGVAVDDVGPLFCDVHGPAVPAGVLRHGDLCQFTSLIAPRPLWLNGSRGRFAFTVDCYSAFGVSHGLRMTEVSPARFDAELPAWIVKNNVGKSKDATITVQ